MTIEPGSPLIDSEFGHGVRALSKILKGAAAKLRAVSENKTRNFITHLRSDRELGAGERELLADLLAGLLTPGPGHPDLNDDDMLHRKNACKAVQDEMARMKSAGVPKPHLEDAIAAVATCISRGSQHDVRLWWKDKKIYLNYNN